MFVLASKITIGSHSFSGVNELKVSKSVFEYANTATISIPASAVLKQNGIKTASVQTARQFKEGDKVSIMLGYGTDNLKNEFKGFVKRINFTAPVQIECEGYSWLLRNKRNIKKSWRTTTLKEVLEEVVKGTGIKLHDKTPHLPLKNLVLNNASGTQVLDYLKDLLKGTLTACFIDDVLYCGLVYMDLTQPSSSEPEGRTAKYRLGWNTINADSLKYRRSEDMEVNAVFQFRDEDGKLVEGGAGAGDAKVTRFEKLTSVTEKKHLVEIAEAKLRQEKYDGYEGSIETFLMPYVQPGYRAETEDPKYLERGGNYFITSVETSFGQSGGRRSVGIGIKLS